MTVGNLKINHVVLRYDNVPQDVLTSEESYRTTVPLRGDFVSKDFFGCRSITPERFGTFIAKKLILQFYDELQRMAGCGLRQVLHADYVGRGNDVFWVLLNSVTVHRLAKGGNGVDICIRGKKKEYVAGLTEESLHLLNRFKFSIELA